MLTPFASLSCSCGMLHRPIKRTLVSFFTLLLFIGTLIAQGEKNLPALEQGKPIEREIAGGQAHFYQVALVKGQFLQVTVEQQSVDVAITLHRPNGEKILAVDLRGIAASESLSFIADSAGEYKIEVAPTDKNAKAGRYQISIVSKGEADETDKNRIAAERLLAEAAEKLNGKLTKENALAALEKRREALRLWQSIGDKDWEAQTLNLIGRVYYSVWNNLIFDEAGIEFYAAPKTPFQLAVEFYNQSLNLSHETKNQPVEADTLFRFSKLYFDAGDNQKVLDYCNLALPIYRNLNDLHGESVSLLNIGAAYVRMNDSPKSIEYSLQAAAIAKENGDFYNEAQAFYNAGIALGNGFIDGKAENFEKSVDAFNRSLESSRAGKLRDFEARAIGFLAWIYGNGKNYQKAIELKNQELAIRRELKERTNEAFSINSIGWNYAKLKDNKRAIEHYEQALAIFRAEKDRSGEATVLRNLGDIRFELGETQTALDLFNQSLIISSDLQEQENVNTLKGKINEAFEAIDGKPISNPQPVEPGKTIEKEIGGIKADNYTVKLEAGQFSRVNLEQKGVDVMVKLYNPDNQKLAERDAPNEAEGPESLSFIVETSGNYRLVVRPINTAAASGHYTLDIESPRTPTERDKTRIEAENTFAEAQRLHQKDFNSLEEFQAAVGKYDKAAQLFKTIDDFYWQALAFQSIAWDYFYNSRDEQKVAEYFSQAASAYHQAGRKTNEAYILLQLAGAYNFNSEDYAKSVEVNLKALDISREIGNQDFEYRALESLYEMYIGRQNRSKALEYLNQALAVAQKSKDTDSEGQTLSNFGVLYLELGEYEKALNYQEKAAAKYPSNNRYARAQTSEAISDIYAALGKHSEALKLEQENLVYYRIQLSQNKNAYRDIVRSLYLIGSAYQRLGNRKKALEYYEESLRIARTNADNFVIFFESMPLFGISSIYEENGDLEKANESFNQLLNLNRKYREPEREAETLYHIAKIESRQNKLSEAQKHIEEAIKISESQRADLKSQELRSSYFATVRDYYEFYIDLLMRLDHEQPGKGFNERAIEASERGRARSLLETLAEANADIRQGVDPKLVGKERALQQRLNAKAQEQMNARSAEQSKTIIAELESITTELEQVRAQIRQTSPRYAALTQPQPLSLTEIQAQVLDADTLLLEYSLGEQRSYLWVVTQTSIASYDLAKRSEIEAAARQVYDLLNARNQRVENETKEQRQARIAQADVRYPQAAAHLGQMILAPAAKQLGNKRLLIVSDGALQYIPFAALLDPTMADATPTPLVVNHEIVSLPSASTLAVLRRETQGRQPANKTLAVLADPVFESSDERVTQRTQQAKGLTPFKHLHRTAQTVQRTQQAKGLTSRRPVRTEKRRELPFGLERAAQESGLRDTKLLIPRLLGTRREAEQILSLVPAAQRKQAFDFAANRATATSADLSQYRYVHFATHGLLDSLRPELSGIVLSLIDENGNAQDGFLRAHEIFNLKLSAELVVLSACKTGLGKEIKGEGLVGFTRGFMYAGSPRVIVSLWSVSDAGTAELMTRLYKEILVNKLRPAKALQVAQVSMLKEKSFSAPFYWAAFIVQGEWR